MRLGALAAGVTPAALLLAACSTGPTPPEAAGVCYSMVRAAPGQAGGVVSAGYRFYALKHGVPDLEHCAAALDGMRVRFLALGGTTHEVAGVYQGEYLFVDGRGVFSSSTLDGATFPLLRRTADGRLVAPSAPDEAPS